MGSYLVLVGLLSFCGFSWSQDCVRNQFYDVDFPGSDLKLVFSPDDRHCQLMCLQHPSCNMFTFIRPDWTRDGRIYHCYLKSTTSGLPNLQDKLVGVTSGYFSNACSLQHDDLCFPKVYSDTDFYGADYQTLFTADYESCQTACTRDPACQFFTFVNDLYADEKIRFKCHLKFIWTPPTPPVISALAGVVSGFSHALRTTSSHDPACVTKLFPDTDIPGSDFQNVPAASPDHCLSLCSSHPHCTFFSYQSKTFKCYMKKNYDSMVTKAMEGVTSGIPARHCHLDNSWQFTYFEDIDFLGTDLYYVMLDNVDTCQRTCSEDPNCQFYTYVTNKSHYLDHRRRCYLKRVITGPTPPKVGHLSNAVSGFSLRACIAAT